MFSLRKRFGEGMENSVSSALQKPAPKEDHSKLVADLILAFTCFVCTNLITTTSIIVCVNEHIVCEVCRPRLVHCPTCRGQWRGRSRLAENLRTVLVENSRIPCPNHANGCTGKYLYTALEQHLLICTSQWVMCPGAFRGLCHWKGALKDMLSHCATRGCAHLMREHRGDYKFTLNFFTGDNQRFNFLMPNPVTTGSYICLYVIKQTHDFLLFAKVLGNSPEETLPSISINLCHGGDVPFSFSGQVLRDNVSLDEVKFSGKFLTLTWRQAFVLRGPEDLLYFHIQILHHRNTRQKR